MKTEKRTKIHRAAPPIAQPTPMKSAVRPARRTQVRAFVVKLARVTFTGLLSADSDSFCQPKVSPAACHGRRARASFGDRSDEQRPFGDSAPRQESEYQRDPP